MEESGEEVDYKTFQPKHKQFKQSDYEEIDWRRFSIWTGVLILAFGSLICTNFLYKEALFKISNNFTESIQTDSKFFNKFMNIIGELGEMNGIIFMLLIYVSFIPYSDTLFILIVLLSVLLLNGMMKLLYHDPRPYFVAKNIEAIDGSTSYGNPSGHSMFFTSVYPGMMVCIIEMINRNNRMSRKLKVIIGTIVVFTVFLIVLILFGRIYLGAHSLDQVLYGSLVGTAFGLYFLFVARKPLDIYFKYFMENRISKEKALMHGLIISFVIFVLALASTTVYIFNDTTFVVPKPWRDAIISKGNVEKNDLLGDESLSKLGLINMITPIGLLGSIIGIISYSHFAPNYVNHLDFLPFKLTGARFVLNILICSPIATLFLLSKCFPFVTRVAIGYFLSQFMYSFMVFGPNRFIFLKLGLARESITHNHEPDDKFEEEKEE